MSKGATTRERIVAQAAPLFNQRGFAGCSMQDIMDATGLEKGGIYRHFRTKEELAVAAYQHSITRVLEARTSPPNPDAGAVEKLRGIIARFVQVPSPIPGGCPIMNTAVDADDGNPALHSLARASLATWKQGLIELVEQGIRGGEVSANTQPTRIANLIIATLEGALLIQRLEGSREALEDASTSLSAMLDTLQPRPSPAPS